MRKKLMTLLYYVPVLIFIGYFFAAFTTSCVATGPVATLSTGTVIQVDGDRVLVTFPVVDKDYSDQAVNWFYIPGHSYEVRDLYPDPTKDPNLYSYANSR